MSKATISSGGIGFGGLLTVLFIGLKLTNYIDWSWLWVLSPLWIPSALILGALVFWLVALMIVTILESILKSIQK